VEHSAAVNVEATTAVSPRWLAVLWWVLIAVALGLARRGDAQFAVLGPPSAGLPWWLAALGALVVAAWLSDRGAPVVPSYAWKRADALALLGVLAIAAVTRLWCITEYPPPDLFAYEEFQTGAVAYGVYQSWQFPWEFPETNIFPGLTFGLIGLDGWGLRVPFLVGGIIAPVFLFLALRRLVALPAAFAAAALLAGARWPAAAARFADEIFFPIWIVALALWLLVRAVQRQRQLDLLLFAVVMSDMFYAYTAYRAIPITVLAFAVLIATLRRWRGERDRATLRHLVLVAVVWIILIGPGLVSGGSFGGSVFAEALNRHAAGRGAAPLTARLEHMWKMMRTGVGVFLVEGDIPPINAGGAPMLDPITGPIAVLSVLLAVWHWRQPWRSGLLAVLMFTFAGITFFPNNLYIGRFFVLLVPLFALIGFTGDDLVRWRRAPGGTSAVIVIAALALAAFNLYGLQRIIDDPGVRETFLVPENTVVAAVHAAPLGARVVMLTDDARNALEQSDYLWHTAGRTGGRPETLSEALTVDATERGPIRWVTQGAPEAALLPQLVAIACRDGEAQMRVGINEMATVGAVQVAHALDCVVPLRKGLSATYTVRDDNGPRIEHQIDPALMAHTIPPSLAWQIFERRVLELRVDWRGTLSLPTPEPYEIRLDLLNATGQLHVGNARREIVTLQENVWQSTSIPLQPDPQQIPLSIELRGQPGLRPSVRLFWRRGDGEAELIPPQALRPD
jgi:hypothetical protein